MEQTPSRKRKLDSNWLTAGKECGSILRSCLWGGALHEDTKSGCVADYNHPSPSIILHARSHILLCRIHAGKKTATFLETVIFTLIKISQIDICKCFTWVKFTFQVKKISISLSPTCMNNLSGRGQGKGSKLDEFWVILRTDFTYNIIAS